MLCGLGGCSPLSLANAVGCLSGSVPSGWPVGNRFRPTSAAQCHVCPPTEPQPTHPQRNIAEFVILGINVPLGINGTPPLASLRAA